MIDDLDESIRQLLIAEMPIRNNEIDISFDQPKREWSARLSRPTINFFMYDLRENPVLRQHQWERMALPQHGDLQAALKRTPFRVDLFYMVTAWATEPEDEHRLLARVLLALFRFPILPTDRLIGVIKDQPFEIQARLAYHDKLTNATDLWNSLDNEMRPSVSYNFTLAFDPWSPVIGPLVRTFTMRTGQSNTLPRGKHIQEDGLASEVHFISGYVRQKSDQTPVEGIQVALKGTGWFTTTDEHGRYSFNSIPGGSYSLVAWPQKGKNLVEKEITIPSIGSAYDLELD